MSVETTARCIAMASRTLTLVPAETVVGHEYQIGFNVERPHVGDEAQHADAWIGRGFGRIGESAPIREVIGAADHRERSWSGNLSRSRGQTLPGEKALGGDVGEMAERSDEEQALAGLSGSGGSAPRSTPFSITAVATPRAPSSSASFGDMTTTRGKRRTARVSKRRQRNDVPRGGECALAAGDLGEEVEGDVVFHQHVAAQYSASCVYSTCSSSKPKDAALLGDGLAHGGRAEFVDFRAAAGWTSAARGSAASSPAPRGRRIPAAERCPARHRHR